MCAREEDNTFCTRKTKHTNVGEPSKNKKMNSTLLGMVYSTNGYTVVRVNNESYLFFPDDEAKIPQVLKSPIETFKKNNGRYLVKYKHGEVDGTILSIGRLAGQLGQQLSGT